MRHYMLKFILSKEEILHLKFNVWEYINHILVYAKQFVRVEECYMC
jgi:hypothetical protein